MYTLLVEVNGVSMPYRELYLSILWHFSSITLSELLLIQTLKKGIFIISFDKIITVVRHTLFFYVIVLLFNSAGPVVHEFPNFIKIKYFWLGCMLFLHCFFCDWCLFNMQFYHCGFFGCPRYTHQLLFNINPCYNQWLPKMCIIINSHLLSFDHPWTFLWLVQLSSYFTLILP